MIKLKHILLTGALTLIFSYSFAADTLKINLTYKHVLNEKGQTIGYKTISQQFLTPDGLFFREINYNDSTSQISNYIFRFYKNGRLFTEECHAQNDALLYILKHEYDAAGNEIMIEKLVPGDGKSLTTLEKNVYSYNEQHKPVSIKKYAGKKTSGSTRFKYDSKGLILNEKSTNKPSAKADVKQEEKVYSHDQDGRISKMTVAGKDNNGKTFQYYEEYSYENGLLISAKRFNADGTPAGEKVYKYLNSGAPSLYEEHDATGRLTLLLQYDYKKHFMEMGTQKSYYEGL